MGPAWGWVPCPPPPRADSVLAGDPALGGGPRPRGLVKPPYRDFASGRVESLGVHPSSSKWGPSLSRGRRRPSRSRRRPAPRLGSAPRWGSAPRRRGWCSRTSPRPRGTRRWPSRSRRRSTPRWGSAPRWGATPRRRPRRRARWGWGRRISPIGRRHLPPSLVIGPKLRPEIERSHRARPAQNQRCGEHRDAQRRGPRAAPTILPSITRLPAILSGAEARWAIPRGSRLVERPVRQAEVRLTPSRWPAKPPHSPHRFHVRIAFISAPPVLPSSVLPSFAPSPPRVTAPAPFPRLPCPPPPRRPFGAPPGTVLQAVEKTRVAEKPPGCHQTPCGPQTPCAPQTP
jgi:hypothetical protein